MSTYTYDVFLSHSSKNNKPAVRALADQLKADGLEVWFDEWVILSGMSIPEAIEEGLQGSKTLLLIMSDDAFASDWVTLERQTARFRDPMNRDNRFVPLLLEDTNIPDMLKHFVYIDYRTQSRTEYDKLLAACR